MPGQETGALVRKIHAPKTGLPRAQEGLADGVIVGPNEVIVDGDVFKLRSVPVRAKDARIVPRCDHQIGVHRALGLVQCVHERTLFLRVELHHVSSHWRIIALEEKKHISSTGRANWKSVFNTQDARNWYIFGSFFALTNRNSLVTVGPGQSVFTAAAVMTTEVSVTLTGTAEKTAGPSFPIIPSVVRVLRPMRLCVHRHRHTLSTPGAGATRVIRQSRRRRAALSTPETLWSHTLSGELSAHNHRAHNHQKAELPHYPKKKSRCQSFTHGWFRVSFY